MLEANRMRPPSGDHRSELACRPGGSSARTPLPSEIAIQSVDRFASFMMS
jgi:hypothetical protein